MHVYLVRHGETHLGAAGVHQSPNTPLSPHGKEQAESVAEYLRSVNPDLILTSGYTRAVETARVIGLHAGTKTKVHELFYEVVRPSSLYHKPLVSLATLAYVVQSFLKRKDPTWHYKDAENYTDLANRASAARTYLEGLSKKHDVVVVVSHNVFIRVLTALLCRNELPGTLEMARIFFGIIRFPHTGVVHLEYARVAPRSKTCAWSIIDDAAKSSQYQLHRTNQTRFHAFFKGLARAVGAFAFITFLTAALFLTFVTKQGSDTVVTMSATSPAPPVVEASFPVGVDVSRKEITEIAHVEDFFAEHIGEEETKQTAWFKKAFGQLALMGWYQNLASLSQRVLVIQPGERKEQVAAHFAKILGWSTEEAQYFLDLVTATHPAIEEGKFFPGTYSVGKNATPEEVAWIVLDTFNQEVLTRYGESVSDKVALSDTLTIASLLEREAYDFTDMREISGVIWNRLFSGMRLQIDATLQYAKGTDSTSSWWPIPRPKDKYIESPYNTYMHEGLPPGAISNPSLAAILAALNPIKTECMFYFHDKDSVFHCTQTYEEHVALLKAHYGQGK